jgi:hypothetical protein
MRTHCGRRSRVPYRGTRPSADDRADPEAESSWTATCEEIANLTLFPKAVPWIFGANIPGKKKAVMFYMAGIGAHGRRSVRSPTPAMTASR